ncbi:MAG: hypothetical protein AAF663_00065 [Planctomycetota bacterium]
MRTGFMDIMDVVGRGPLDHYHGETVEYRSGVSGSFVQITAQVARDALIATLPSAYDSDPIEVRGITVLVSKDDVPYPSPETDAVRIRNRADDPGLEAEAREVMAVLQVSAIDYLLRIN